MRSRPYFKAGAELVFGENPPGWVFPGHEAQENNMLKRLIDECDGQDMVEYGLLVGVVALGCVAALNSFQTVISNVWTMISNNLSGAG
jgi:Flp pilus assembly pilin Flp